MLSTQPPIQRALVTKWHHAYFAQNCAPSVQWVKDMIRKGVYSGEKVGGIWYIHIYAGTREPVKPNDAPPRTEMEQIIKTGNVLADMLMEDYLRKVG